MKIIPVKEVKLDSEKDTEIFLPAGEKVENLQLEISCGFAMLGKKLRIKLCGETKTVDLPQVTLSQMYRMLINVRTLLPKESGWLVTRVILSPVEKISHPISFGINCITGIVCFSFGLLLSFQSIGSTPSLL